MFYCGLKPIHEQKFRSVLLDGQHKLRHLQILIPLCKPEHMVQNELGELEQRGYARAHRKHSFIRSVCRLNLMVLNIKRITFIPKQSITSFFYWRAKPHIFFNLYQVLRNLVEMTDLKSIHLLQRHGSEKKFHTCTSINFCTCLLCGIGNLWAAGALF